MNYLLIIALICALIPAMKGQQCLAAQFTVKNNGVDYLTINSPNEVRTCGGINICDAITEAKQSIALNNGELSISAGNSVELPDKSDTNEIQTLTLQSGQLSISNGNSVQLPSEIQTLSLQGETVSLSNGGGSFSLPDSSANNEIQSISLQDGAIGLSKDSATVDIRNLKSFLGFSVIVTPVGIANTPTGWHPVPFNSINWITFPESSFNIATYSFTPPYAGYYRFNLRGLSSTPQNSGTDRFGFAWNVNTDGIYYGYCGGACANPGSPIPPCSYVMPLNASVTVRTVMSSTVSFNLGAANDPPTSRFEWQGEYLGPL